MNQTVTGIIQTAMKSNDSIKFAPVLVTPDVANAILECNYQKNRPLSNYNITSFRDLLKSGAWTDGSPIRFARDCDEYVLVDGQHRLHAIIEENVPARFIAIVDKHSPSQAYSIADAAGRNRTLSDGVHANGIGNGWSKVLLNSYSGAIRIIGANFSALSMSAHATQKKISLANSEAKYWHETMEDVIAALLPLPKTITSTRSWMKSPVLACLLATWRHQESARQFWIDSILDDGLSVTRPEKFMHVVMATPGKRGGAPAQAFVNRVARIWNVFYNNREIKNMPVDTNPFPGLLGTPYTIAK